MKASSEKSSSTTSTTTKQTASQPFFAKAGGGDFFAPAATVQTKMKLNKPGDKFEQEADQMADKVMRMTVPASPVNEEKLQRQPEEKLQKKKEDKIQKSAIPEEKIQKKEDEKLQKAPANKEKPARSRVVKEHVKYYADVYGKATFDLIVEITGAPERNDLEFIEFVNAARDGVTEAVTRDLDKAPGIIRITLRYRVLAGPEPRYESVDEEARLQVIHRYGTKPTAGECKTSHMIFIGEKGTVNFYLVGKENLMQAGKTEVRDTKTATTGSFYMAAVEIDPKDCGELQFIQNAQVDRVVTFKDASRLECKTPWGLDTDDPYPTYPAAEPSKNNIRAVYTSDSPAQGTGGVDGFIDTLTVTDTFKLYLMVKSKTGRKTVGLANWNWKGKLANTDKKDIKAPLELESGNIEAPNGAASTEAPLLTPNVGELQFKVIGTGKTLASIFEKRFNGRK